MVVAKSHLLYNVHIIYRLLDLCFWNLFLMVVAPLLHKLEDNSDSLPAKVS